MAIEAKISSYKLGRIKIFAIICLVLAGWCAYDGYFNQKWIGKHTNEDGSPKTYLVFNRRAPYFLVPGAILFGIYFLSILNKKVVADEDKLIVDGTEIKYDSIVKLNKTYFDSKGYFILTYEDGQGGQIDKKISDGRYDNLKQVLDHVVAKMS